MTCFSKNIFTAGRSPSRYMAPIRLSTESSRIEGFCLPPPASSPLLMYRCSGKFILTARADRDLVLTITDLAVVR